jgi:hypothetical protein
MLSALIVLPILGSLLLFLGLGGAKAGSGLGRDPAGDLAAAVCQL